MELTKEILKVVNKNYDVKTCKSAIREMKLYDTETGWKKNWIKKL